MLVLIPLIIILLFSPVLYRKFFGLEYNTYEEDKRLLDSLVTQINAGLVKPEQPGEKSIQYFVFDPNKASIAQLKSLGVPDFLANRIENYRNKGGRFNVKRDFSKIYDFPDSLYLTLEPFIDLPAQSILQPQIKSAPPKLSNNDKAIEIPIPPPEKGVVLDLNAADTIGLKRLKGIGSVYARRITAYGSLLGGYHSLDQLKEVYGMNDTLFHEIIPFLTISDSLTLRKIPINLATFRELLAHPYIGYDQTKEILNLKSKHGKFRKPEDLFRLTLMDSGAIERLLPYIRF